MQGSFQNFNSSPLPAYFFNIRLKTFFGRQGLNPIISLALLIFFAVIPAKVRAASPQLKISGNQIVNASSGCTVRLKGVDVSGLEYSPTGDTGNGYPTTVVNGVTMTDYVSIITEAVQVWHANCIRFPLNQDFWFGCSNGNGSPNQTAYKDMIQAVVNYCSQNNVYVDLDLHWSGTYSGTAATSPCSGGGWGTATGQQNMPDWNSVTFWSSVASTYANNSAVLFDMYNEPHDVSWSVWQNGGSTGATPSNTPGLQALLNAIRSAGANNIVVAGGLNWAFDLTGLSTNALSDSGSGNGILYSSHCYSSKGYTVGSGWDPYVTIATPNHAVIIEEFGATASDGASWDNSAISWINGNNNKSYVYSAMAWAFSSDVGPTLLTSFSGYPTTSYHGAPVSTWLYNVNQTPTPNCSGGGSTPTFTYSPTKTNTPTFTFTPSLTPTFTFTKTSTPSSTATPTFTSSSTFTRTATGTPSSTSTSTFSPSATPTKTNSPTNTATSTYSSTASATPSRTNSFTATPSSTASATATSTASPTRTNTPIPTNTSTSTSTPSPSATRTNTPANTPTTTATPTLTLVNTATPTNTVAATSTKTNTPSSTATGSPTNSPVNTPSSTVTPTLTIVNTPTPTDTVAATSTKTNTPTATLTWTTSKTPSETPTPTFSNTPSGTFTPTSTMSSSPTASRTSTPSAKPTAVLYPNPSNGQPVQLIPGLVSPSNVKVEIFTIAFRKVNLLEFTNVQPGQSVTIPLTDHWGSPLASGLYYLSIDTNEGRSVLKLLVLR